MGVFALWVVGEEKKGGVGGGLVGLALEQGADELGRDLTDLTVEDGVDDRVALADAVGGVRVCGELQPRGVAEAERDLLLVVIELGGDVHHHLEHDHAPAPGVLGDLKGVADGATLHLDDLDFGPALVRVVDRVHGRLKVEAFVDLGHGLDAEGGRGDGRRLPGAVEARVVDPVHHVDLPERDGHRERLHGALGRELVPILLPVTYYDDFAHLPSPFPWLHRFGPPWPATGLALVYSVLFQTGFPLPRE